MATHVCNGLENDDETTNVGKVSLLFHWFDCLLMLCIIDIPQERNQRRPSKRSRLDILDMFDDEHCEKFFRFDKPSILYIKGKWKTFNVTNLCFYSSLLVLVTGLIEEDLQRSKNSNPKLEPIHLLLIALQFYATGNYRNTFRNRIWVNKTSAHSAINCVSKALSSIAPSHIKFPEDLGAVSTYVL